VSEDKQELAEDRTDLAEDRTVLANERTFAGWFRTGFASIAVGAGFNALFQTLEPVWVPKALATVFLIIAIFIFVTAERRATHVMSKIHPHKVEEANRTNYRLVTMATTLATLGLIAALWLLEMKTGSS
jgi:putative membrane protein